MNTVTLDYQPDGRWALCVNGQPLDDARYDHATGQAKLLEWQRDLAEINRVERELARRSA